MYDKIKKHLSVKSINLFKKDLDTMETINKHSFNRQKFWRHQTNLNYRNEDDRLTDEISKTNLHDVNHKKEQRRKIIKQIYNEF